MSAAPIIEVRRFASRAELDAALVQRLDRAITASAGANATAAGTFATAAPTTAAAAAAAAGGGECTCGGGVRAGTCRDGAIEPLNQRGVKLRAGGESANFNDGCCRHDMPRRRSECALGCALNVCA